MVRGRGYLGCLVAAAATIAATACTATPAGVATADLIELFPSAIEVRPGPAVFAIADAVAGGRTNRSIVVTGSSRLVYRVTVPANGALAVSISLPDGSPRQTSTLFRVMVATDGSPGPDVMFSRRLDPAADPRDRGWHEISVNLTPFATETVSLYLNTNTDDPASRSAWGQPRLVR